MISNNNKKKNSEAVDGAPGEKRPKGFYEDDIVPVDDKGGRDTTRRWWLLFAVLFTVSVILVWVLQPREFSSSQARVKHILVTFKQGDPVDRARALELINDLQRRLKNGDSFGKLAKQYSNDSFSSARGGDLGYQPRGIYSKNFENYVWSAPIGQLSDIIETEHGFHIVEVTDRFVAKADEYEINLEKKYAPKGAATPATDEPKPEVKPVEGQ